MNTNTDLPANIEMVDESVDNMADDAVQFENLMNLLTESKDEQEADEQEDLEIPTTDLEMEEEDEDGDVDEEDEDDDEEEDGEEDEDSDEEDAEEDEEFDESEPTEVDFDTVITLPNGEDITIEKLQEGYREGSLLDAEKEAFEEERTAFKEQSKNVAEQLDLAKLEADRILDDFKDFDWQGLAAENPQEFANTKLFVEKYAQRSMEIRKQQEIIQGQEATAKAAAKDEEAREAVEILQRDIPDWNRELYTKVLDHAINLGMDRDEALNLTDPMVIKLLVKDLHADEGKRRVTAKISRKAKTPTKAVKSKAKKPIRKPVKADYTNEAEELAFFNSIIKR